MPAFIRRATFLLGLCAAPWVHAQLSIEVTGAGANRIPVAVAEFAGDQGTSRALTSVVRADLERSGLFTLIDADRTGLDENSQPPLADWKARGADALSVGSLVAQPGNKLETRFRLYDTQKNVSLGGRIFAAQVSHLRLAGHTVADYIYEKLTGERGIFATRIAYVTRVGKRYELKVADADGQGAQTVIALEEPIISPAWSPDGNKLAYVSFEKKKPVIYVHELSTGRRITVANYKGSNSAPAWSPDGQKLAIVLTKDGRSQIYSINADGSGLQRLTQSYGIDTEPRYTPDGANLYFTSDRGGSPQIYRMSAQGGEVQRISFEGGYNVTPRLSPDGKTLAYITRREGHFQLAVMDLASRQTQILTDSRKDESPTFAPNGRMILIATEIGGRGVLSAVSADGRIKQRLSVAAGDVREPAWAPFAP